MRGESPFPSLAAPGMGPGASAASSVGGKSKRGDLASAEEGKKMIRNLIEGGISVSQRSSMEMDPAGQT